MALVKVIRHGQITLPAAFRSALAVAEGDYLEAELVDDQIVLRPAAVVSRQAAWRQLREAQAGVRYVGPGPRLDPEAEEELIHEEVAEHRRDA